MRRTLAMVQAKSRISMTCELFLRLVKIFTHTILVTGVFLTASCRSFHIEGNQGGSLPINEHEFHQMQREVQSCHRAGGTRVVKITGNMRCF
jgi:hypothetical protein